MQLKRDLSTDGHSCTRMRRLLTQMAARSPGDEPQPPSVLRSFPFPICARLCASVSIRMHPWFPTEWFRLRVRERVKMNPVTTDHTDQNFKPYRLTLSLALNNLLDKLLN